MASLIQPMKDVAFDAGSLASGHTTLPHYTALDAATSEFTFHLYRGRGLFNDNIIVKSENKMNVLYFLRVPFTFGHNWNDVTLYNGREGGPIVAKLNKPKRWSRSDIQVAYYPQAAQAENKGAASIGSPLAFTMKAEGRYTGNHSFALPDGRVVRWTGTCMNWNMRLVDVQTGAELGRWSLSAWSCKKLGKLYINQTLEEYLEIILTTGVAMSCLKEQRRKTSGG